MQKDRSVDQKEQNRNYLKTPVPISRQQWPEDSLPLVAVSCLTYNHVNFIEKAINGFLLQETTFPVMILIFDDCSTDGTAEKIKKYEEKYHHILKAFCMEENTFRKPTRKKVQIPFLSERAKAKYVAFCEGDDYWIDPQKLQKQVMILEGLQNVTLCCHSALETDVLTGRQEVVCRNLKQDGFLPFKQVVTRRGGYIPTASIVIRNEILIEIKKFLYDAPIGDFFIQAYAALTGEVYFLDFVGSVYQRNLAGSWTNSQKQKNNKTNYYLGMVKSIDLFYKLVPVKRRRILIRPLTFYLVNYIYLLPDDKAKRKIFFELIKKLDNVSRIRTLAMSSIYFLKTKIKSRIGYLFNYHQETSSSEL